MRPELLRRLARAAHDRNEDIVDATLERLCKWSGWDPAVIDYMSRMEPRLQEYVNARIEAATSEDVARLRAAMTADDDEYHGGLPLPRGCNGGAAGFASVAGVTLDTAAQKHAPATDGEWTLLMSAAGLATGNPTHAWLHSAAASPMPDVIGADAMTLAAAAITWQAAKAGWSRVGTQWDDGSIATLLTAATYNSSTLLLAYVGLTATPAASRSVAYAQGEVGIETTRAYSGDTDNGAADAGTTVRPVLLKVDRTGSVKKIYTDQETIAQTYASATNVAGFGSVIVNAAPMWVGYSALFTGAAAEISDEQVRTLLQTLGWTVAW